MSLSKRDSEPKPPKPRSFGLIFAAFFAIVALAPLLHHRHPRLGALVIAAVFLALALAAPGSLAVPNRLWFRFSLLLSSVMTPVQMFVFYFAVLTPFGWLARLFGKDPLNLTIDRRAASYWIARKTPGPAPETMKLQF